MSSVLPSSAAQLGIERLQLSQKNLPLALLIFAIPIVGFCLNFVALLAIGWPFALPLVIAGGWFTGMAFIVGHDASHQSFTASHRLNAILGRISFLPSLTSFSLWDLVHNRVHHRYNNVRAFDYVWEPMSPEDYAAATPRQRLRNRIFRSGLGIPLYYMFDIWLPRIFLVRRVACGTYRRDYVLDGFLVWGFLVFEIAAAVFIGDIFGRSAAEALLLAVVAPFLVWNALMSLVIYVHHTHPEVAWYASVEEWRSRNGRLTGTVHVRFPWVVRKLMLNIMDHNAHHYAPGIPLYNLTHMQQQLDTEQVVEWDWSMRGYFDVVRQCKLFDYASGQWIPYPESALGHPTE